MLLRPRFQQQPPIESSTISLPDLVRIRLVHLQPLLLMRSVFPLLFVDFHHCVVLSFVGVVLI